MRVVHGIVMLGPTTLEVPPLFLHSACAVNDAEAAEDSGKLVIFGGLSDISGRSAHFCHPAPPANLCMSMGFVPHTCSVDSMLTARYPTRAT